MSGERGGNANQNVKWKSLYLCWKKIWLNWISLYYIDNFQVHWQNCSACLIKTKKVDVTQRIQKKPRNRFSFYFIHKSFYHLLTWNNNYLEWIMFIYLAENRQSQLYLWWEKHMSWSNVEELSILLDQRQQS